MYKIRPSVAWLTVNRKCNFRCKWCYAQGTNYTKSEMSFESAKTFANMCRQIGIQNLLIIGGEPTLWRHLFKFNKFCISEGIQSALVTNGARFGIDNFWERYLQYPNTKIGLSLKGSTPQQLFEVANVNNFETIEKGIIRAIRELNAGISLTYNMFYVDTLINMVQFAVKCGAKGVKIDFCSTTFISGQPNAIYMLDPRKLAENIMKDYSELERITNGHIVFEMMIPFCLWPPDFINELKCKGQLLSVCHVLKRKGIIFDEIGNILLCNALFDYPLGKYGNEFYDGVSLLKWLNTPQIRSFYDRIRCYPSTKCITCYWYSDCGGGCPLRWALYKPDEVIRPIIKEDFLLKRR